MRKAAPRRLLNPHLLRRVSASNINKQDIARAAGWPYYVQSYATLRSERDAATPLTVERLMKVADRVGFPRDEVFLDSHPGATE